MIDQIHKAKKLGLFKNLGFSSHDSPDNVNKLLKTGIFDTVMLPYNLLQRDYEDSLKLAFKLDLGVMIMNPLAGGLLVNSNIYLSNIRCD